MESIVSLNISDGGVPKWSVNTVLISKRGLTGDRQAKPGIHGGIYKAVSLFSLQAIQALAEQGHPIAPGSTGENITLSGELWDEITPGLELRLGDEVIIKVTSYATPCPTIINSFSDGDVLRLHHKKSQAMSRLYAQVIREGEVAVGDVVTILQ